MNRVGVSRASIYFHHSTFDFNLHYIEQFFFDGVDNRPMNIATTIDQLHSSINRDQKP